MSEKEKTISVINSLQNPKIKFFNSLKKKKAILLYQKFLIEGENLLKEAYRLGILEQLLIVDQNKGQEYKVPKILVTSKIIEKLSTVKTNSQEIIGIGSYRQNWIDFKNTKKLIVLEEIRNPENFGSIMRSAKAFGFENIVLLGNCLFPYNDKAIRASQGAIFSLNIQKLDDHDFLNNFNCYHFTTNRKAESLQKLKFDKTKANALVFGNEKRGISENLLKKILGKEIFIKINDFDSLNLAIAAAIAMYQFEK